MENFDKCKKFENKIEYDIDIQNFGVGFDGTTRTTPSDGHVKETMLKAF